LEAAFEVIRDCFALLCLYHYYYYYYYYYYIPITMKYQHSTLVATMMNWFPTVLVTQ
jgi:hypothetical protein